MWKTALVIASALALAGCATQRVTVATVEGGACKVAHTPNYVVLGKTNYDQGWVNRTTEGLVVGCGQPRPLARPASFDAKPAKAQPVAAPPPKKKRWWTS